ncbi:MAG: ABC transporter permease subunit [Candidatus Nomurabacteria bacterium]|nr:MAG: ABC transporter permease subunit [Candidatus Nomurabacteria bacterium]
MFRSVLLKTIFNLRWQLLGWMLSITFVAFLTMVLFNSFNQQGIESIVNSVPDSLKSLVGDVADFKTIPGYVGQQIFGPNVVILTIAMSIIVFIGISASEEDSRRLQSLLSLPVTRTSVYFQKWLALVFFIAVVCSGIVAGVYLALPIIDKSVDFPRIMQSAFDAWLMNVAYGLVAFSVAMAFGKKGLTVAVASGYAALSFIISSLAPAVKELQAPDKLSIFHYYNNPQIMQHGLNTHHVYILVGVIVVLTIVGWLGFIRRDIQT